MVESAVKGKMKVAVKGKKSNFHFKGLPEEVQLLKQLSQLSTADERTRPGRTPWLTQHLDASFHHTVVLAHLAGTRLAVGVSWYVDGEITMSADLDAFNVAFHFCVLKSWQVGSNGAAAG